MNFDDTLLDCFLHWKSIFRTRADVLDHLFCVIGNGYEWRRGELVEKNPDDWKRMNPYEHMIAGATGAMREALLKLKAEDDALPIGPLADDAGKRHFYPVCEYSKLNTVPTDVRPDWLAAAIETAHMLIARADNEATVDAARQALASLERFQSASQAPREGSEGK